MDEKNKKKEIAKISIFITSIFVIFMSVTYGFISMTITGTKKQVITAGTLDLILEEDSNNISLTDALPMYDEVGMIQEPFTFRLVNNGTADANYIVKLVEVATGTKLTLSDVKYELEKDGAKSIDLLSTLTGGVIDSGTIKGNQTINYTLRLWIKDTVTDNSAISGKSLSYKIEVETGQKIEVLCRKDAISPDSSGANLPEMTCGMIPVVYDESDKTWEVADTTNGWYDYNTQKWANAVTVTETNRATYMSASAGTPISMDDINTMWVWIPRYEYQYTNLGDQYAGGTKDLPGEIKINFISASQTTPSDTNTYKIPEGFKFGDENIPGFWIGKFETTGSITTACTDENCTTADLTIKPNLSSVTSQTVSSMFYASRSMQNSSNAKKYGFDTIGTGTMDTHMLKNTEWGIVAMLSQSKYGKYGNPNYSGTNKEVYQNKSSGFITGMSNGIPSQSTYNTQVTYDIPDTGYGASTTGTIYGVYDMSGGAFEKVMGNYNSVSGYSTSFNSGFCGTNGPTTGCVEWPDAKYYDLYTSDTGSAGYKSGDATYETIYWYSDNSSFVNSSYPWFERGGCYSDNASAGVFNTGSSYGNAYGDDSFRLAIKP